MGWRAVGTVVDGGGVVDGGATVDVASGTVDATDAEDDWSAALCRIFCAALAANQEPWLLLETRADTALGSTAHHTNPTITSATTPLAAGKVQAARNQLCGRAAGAPVPSSPTTIPPTGDPK